MEKNQVQELVDLLPGLFNNISSTLLSKQACIILKIGANLKRLLTLEL
jgi:hypothetical protein